MVSSTDSFGINGRVPASGAPPPIPETEADARLAAVVDLVPLSLVGLLLGITRPPEAI